MFKFILPCLLLQGCVSIDSLDKDIKLSSTNTNCYTNENACYKDPEYIKQVFDHYCKGSKQMKAVFELNTNGLSTKEVKEMIADYPTIIKYFYQGRHNGSINNRKYTDNIIYFIGDTRHSNDYRPYRPVELYFPAYYIIKRSTFDISKWDRCEYNSEIMNWQTWIEENNVIQIKQTILENDKFRYDTTIDLTYFCKNAIHVENCKF